SSRAKINRREPLLTPGDGVVSAKSSCELEFEVRAKFDGPRMHRRGVEWTEVRSEAGVLNARIRWTEVRVVEDVQELALKRETDILANRNVLGYSQVVVHEVRA